MVFGSKAVASSLTSAQTSGGTMTFEIAKAMKQLEEALNKGS